MWGRKSQTTIPVSGVGVVPGLSTSSSAASVISSITTTSSGSSSNGSLSQVPNGTSTGETHQKGHARRPSTVSTTSSASASDTGEYRRGSYLFQALC